MTDLDRPVTRRELREELARLATKEDYKAFADEVRRHFDVVGESLRANFKNLQDWVEANGNGLAKRIDILETDHGGQLLNLETRVTALESGRPTREKPPQ